MLVHPKFRMRVNIPPDRGQLGVRGGDGVAYGCVQHRDLKVDRDERSVFYPTREREETIAVRAVVHIGPHKTGTTYLQQMFESLSAEDLTQIVTGRRASASVGRLRSLRRRSSPGGPILRSRPPDGAIRQSRLPRQPGRGAAI